MTESTELSRRHVRHELVVRHLTVAAVRPVTSHIVRVTLTGELDAFAADGPSDHLKVFFPDPATGCIATPGFHAGGIGLSAPGQVIARDYTPLDFRPDDGISFEPEFNKEYMAKQGKPPMRREPSGTNLFDATQAEAMIRYLVEGLPAT